MAVASGGSMTPDVLKLWIQKVWFKRPTATIFRPANILGWDMHHSHLHEEVAEMLQKTCNTTCQYVPGMTSIMAGPDTHYNKPFKQAIREQMDSYLESQEYLLTKTGKIQPAPYGKICDWVVAAWAAIPAEVIVNSFVDNGWDQFFNRNDTTVLHTTLRDIVDKLCFICAQTIQE